MQKLLVLKKLGVQGKITSFDKGIGKKSKSALGVILS